MPQDPPACHGGYGAPTQGGRVRPTSLLPSPSPSTASSITQWLSSHVMSPSTPSQDATPTSVNSGSISNNFERGDNSSFPSTGNGLWINQANSGTYKENKKSTNNERDPVIIERSNLVNILKLVIKEVIDSSLKFGRQLDSDHIPLQHFFIVLEHVLRHGLRPKKGLLGPKKELWDLLQLVEKSHSEAVDITASVRDLPTVKTNLGRARAWLRLAIMQKKLADYFRTLVEQRDDIMSEFYEPRSLLRSEESAHIVGLLVTLNVVDCNLCVKEEDLDSQQGVIDFSLYLRNKRECTNSDSNDTNNSEGNNRMSAVLDQKNYIEELNRHLTATVTNLETKNENLSTTNALMREDLTLTKKALAHAQEENNRLLVQLESNRLGMEVPEEFSSDQFNATSRASAVATAQKNKKTAMVTSTSTSSALAASAASAALAKNKEMVVALAESAMKKQDLERDLKLQVSMRAEMEMAMKLLEKDAHEKETTIVSLRDQLEDIKSINMEMYSKLQVANNLQRITSKALLQKGG